MTKLAGTVVAISVSEGPDMGRLGYPRREVERVLFTMCAALVRSGARILYGGNLDPSGYTFKTFRHLSKAYGIRRATAPFIHFIPEPILRRTAFCDLKAMLAEARGTADTYIVLGDGVVHRLASVGPESVLLRRGAAEQVILDASSWPGWLDSCRPADPRDAYAAARRIFADRSHARVLMGGRMGLADLPGDQYEGAMPGVVEEALLTLEREKPLVILAAFGGAARDVAIALGMLSEADRVDRGRQNPSYDAAIGRVSRFRSRIPADDLAELRRLAQIDYAESLAYRAIDYLATKIRKP